MYKRISYYRLKDKRSVEGGFSTSEEVIKHEAHGTQFYILSYPS